MTARVCPDCPRGVAGLRRPPAALASFCRAGGRGPHQKAVRPPPALLSVGRLAAGLLLAGALGGLVPGTWAQPLIQEVLYDGEGADGDDAFTEIRGPAGMSLEGWGLVGINGGTGEVYRTVSLSGGVIPADGLLVVATSEAAAALQQVRDLTGAVDWQNGPDAVQLRDPEGHVVDALQYGDAGVHNAGEGTPAPAVEAGSSLSRDAAGTDTGDNAADFAPQAVPTPGSLGAAPPGEPDPGPEPSLSVSVPDTLAGRGDTLSVPLRVSGATGRGIVSLEIFLSFDRSVLEWVSLSPSGALVAASWTWVHHLAAGAGSTVDTLKLAAASSGQALPDTQALFTLDFAVAPVTHPAWSRLGLEHVLFNAALPAQQVGHGGCTVVGADASLAVSPGTVRPGGAVLLEVQDADLAEPAAVQVTIGVQEEQLLLPPRGGGVFADSLALVAGPPATGNGELEVQGGDQVTFCYVDSLDASGQTTPRCAALVVLGRSADGQLDVTGVAQPGDTLWVRLIDADLNAGSTTRECATVRLVRPTTAEYEALTLEEAGLDDSLFFGALPTSLEAGPSGDGRLTLTAGESVLAAYDDALAEDGTAAQRQAATQVVALFGDVDGNGLSQAFDAACVLTHVVAPFLSGRDSLAANVDSLAPASPITPVDAALILQRRVGLLGRYPVQRRGSRNHPQPLVPPAGARPAADLRLVCLQESGGDLAVWLSCRDGITSGELLLGGTATVRAVEAVPAFLVAWRQDGERVHIAFAGPAPLQGPGPLLHLRRSEPGGDLRVLRAVLNDGEVAAQVATVVQASAAAEAPPAALYPVYPNPFNPVTAIRFALPSPRPVCLEILNELGQVVRTLVAGPYGSGLHQTVWDARDEAGGLQASGVYFCRLRAGSFTATRPLLLAH
ncbi:MAG: lamin tail domain-containing protein [Candidatus Latescibacterota bacterium]